MSSRQPPNLDDLRNHQLRNPVHSLHTSPPNSRRRTRRSYQKPTSAFASSRPIRRTSRSTPLHTPSPSTDPPVSQAYVDNLQERLDDSQAMIRRIVPAYLILEKEIKAKLQEITALQSLLAAEREKLQTVTSDIASLYCPHCLLANSPAQTS